MRLRLVHTLSLLLLSAVCVAVLALGGLMAWNLRNGFADYLAARDVERLEQFAALVADRALQDGGATSLLQGRIDMRELLREFAQREGVPAGALPPGGGPRGPDDRAPPSGPPGLGPPSGGGRGGPPPPGGPDAFGARVAVYGLDDRILFGRPLPAGDGAPLQRPVLLDGQPVAWVRMRPGKPVPDAVEARFLRSQYVGIITVAAALMVLALAGAWWLARRWVRPLLSVQEATARIARGELGVRLGGARTDEIGDVMRNVDRMAAGLQQLEGTRRRWIADISHELRTPLAVLRGEIEALVDGVRPLRPEAIVSLREEVLRLGSLVDDLHLLAMSDLEALPCHFAGADAVQVLRGVMRRFELQAADAGIALQLEAPPEASIPVQWDAKRIEQLLANLLDNSLRYTDAPGRVVASMKRAGDTVVIDLDDSAPGVPAADVERLFEPLYRADAARSRNTGGSGLGLAICEAIVRAHGGRIGASPSALGGLRVHVELPVSPGGEP